MSDKPVVQGELVFNNLITPDAKFNPDKPSYSIVITIKDDEHIKMLEGLGVKLRDYTNDQGVTVKQRTFKSYKPLREADVIDASGTPADMDIPRGSIVRVQFDPWDKLEQRIIDQYGVSTYLQRICVLEEAERKSSYSSDLIPDQPPQQVEEEAADIPF